MITPAPAWRSISLNSLILSSSRSGAASCTKSAFEAISSRLVVNVSLPRLAERGLRSLRIDGQATSIAVFSLASASGATS